MLNALSRAADSLAGRLSLIGLVAVVCLGVQGVLALAAMVTRRFGRF